MIEHLDDILLFLSSLLNNLAKCSNATPLIFTISIPSLSKSKFKKNLEITGIKIASAIPSTNITPLAKNNLDLVVSKNFLR
jgi:hypothetical protein